LLAGAAGHSNEVIFALQGPAVAGIITIVDLTGAARIINSCYAACSRRS
jgi:arginine/ornithine transport system permease protein